MTSPARMRQVITDWLQNQLLGSIQETLSEHTTQIRTLEGHMSALSDALRDFRARADAESTRIAGVLADLKARLDSGDAAAAAEVSRELSPVIDTLGAMGTGGPADPLPTPDDGGAVPAGS